MLPLPQPGSAGLHTQGLCQVCVGDYNPAAGSGIVKVQIVRPAVAGMRLQQGMEAKGP